MSRAMRVCTTNGCPELTKSGKCQSCRRADSKNRKPERKDYGTRWRVFSKWFLSQWPNCFQCGAKAVHVDHIDGQGINGPRAFDPDNCQSLCVSCHSSKTAKFDGGFGRVAADGRPLQM